MPRYFRRYRFPRYRRYSRRGIGSLYRKFATRKSFSYMKEVKCLDVPIGVTSGLSPGADQIADTTTWIQCLNQIQVGSGYFQRVGSIVSMRKLHLTIHLHPNPNITTANANPGPDLIRIALVYDRQPNGSIPSYTDIFNGRDQAGTSITYNWEPNATVGAVASSTLTPRNMDNRDRFVVLYDRHISIGGNIAATTFAGNQFTGLAAVAFQDGELMRDVSKTIHINLKGLKTVYNKGSSPAVLADINEGSLLLVVDGEAGTTTAQFAFFGNSRLRYID